MIKITLNKSGYEPFFDFIKAYAILCVLMGHTIPFLKETGYSLWYGMQVPLFVLIQAFHALKKESFSFSIKKISKRIIYPFLLIQTIPIVYELFKNGYTNKLITSWLIGGVRTGSILSLDISSVSSSIGNYQTLYRKRI